MQDAIQAHTTPKAATHVFLGDAEAHLIQAESMLEALRFVELGRENGEAVSSGLASDLVEIIARSLRLFRAALASGDVQ